MKSKRKTLEPASGSCSSTFSDLSLPPNLSPNQPNEQGRSA